jgi:LCP family protein required for cell wall assembly
MQREHDRDAQKHDAILEKQLERLFSDAFLPPSATPEDRQPSPARLAPATPDTTRPVPEPALSRRFWPANPSVIKWAVTVLVVFVLVALATLVMDIIYGETPGSQAAIQPPDPGATEPARVAASGILANPAASPTAMATHNPESGTGVQNASVSLPSATKRFPFTPIVEPAQTARATPSLPPDTATPVPPTPTIPRVRRVYPATATPFPAYAMGLSQVPTPVPRLTMPEKAINIALLGSDQRPYEEGYWRTDVVIVVSVNPDIPSVSMLSIPRDLWLYIPNWAYQRINLADSHGAQVDYPGGGPGLVKAAIEYNLGIHVDYFARVDFAGLMHIVDALDGIDVLLDCPVADGFPDNPITEDPSEVTQISYPEPGIYHLDGKHALWLARSRKTTSEFARSRRQHRILQAIWNKAKQLGFIARLPELWQELTATVETDLSLDNVLWLASVGLQLDLSQIRSDFIDGRYLTAWVSPGGGNVLLPHTEPILKVLEPFFNPYPYTAPQGFNRVEVLNGSGKENWGWLAADRLARNGFEVVSVQEADQISEHTTILDFTQRTKGSPLELLQELLSANAAHVPVAGTVESQQNIAFRIVVGEDYQPCELPVPAQWSPTPTPSSATGN